MIEEIKWATRTRPPIMEAEESEESNDEEEKHRRYPREEFK